MTVSTADTVETKVCPYCASRKPLSEFTNEHVIPKALGGILSPTNPLLLKVCRNCNSNCGLYVDEPFVKSWMVKQETARIARDCAAMVGRKRAELVYVGVDTRWSDPTCVCEIWMGPSGEEIYHFHKPYPIESVSTIIGKPSVLKQSDIDSGTVFVSFATNSDFWLKLFIRTLKESFKGARFIFINWAPEGMTAPFDPDNKIEVTDEATLARYNWINSLESGKLQGTFNLSEGCSNRFIFKLALGVGALFLSPTFAESEDARRLRVGLWSRDTSYRAGLGATLFHAFGPLGKISEKTSIKDCHIISLMSLYWPQIQPQPALALFASIYGKLPLTCLISRNESHWSNIISSHPMEARTYVVSPTLKTFVGPIPLAELIAYKYHGSPSLALSDLEDRQNSIPPLPALHNE